MDPLKPIIAELEECRREFERYFMGLEKRLPGRLRDQINRRVRAFDPGKDAVLRFRHQNLFQRLMVLEQYWNRVLRQIENGTFERDVKRANFREAVKARDKVEADPKREARAKAKASAVADEASDFLASLGVSMRGASKAPSGAPRSRSPGSRSPRSLAPKSDAPRPSLAPMRGASKAPDGAPRRSLAPMRGTSKAPDGAPRPSLAPMRGAPPRSNAPRSNAPRSNAPRSAAPRSSAPPTSAPVGRRRASSVPPLPRTPRRSPDGPRPAPRNSEFKKTGGGFPSMNRNPAPTISRRPLAPKAKPGAPPPAPMRGTPPPPAPMRGAPMRGRPKGRPKDDE